MKEFILLIIGAALVNNVILNQFLGICAFLGVSKQTKTAIGMGGAVTFVTILSSFITGLINKFILVKLDLVYLQTIVFIIVIAALVQLVELFLKKYSPVLFRALGVYLPLITTNCAVLGVALMNVQKEYSVLKGTVHGIGVGAGFTLAIILMASIRERTENSDIPKPFRGTPSVLLAAGLMAIAFTGFAGLL